MTSKGKESKNWRVKEAADWARMSGISVTNQGPPRPTTRPNMAIFDNLRKAYTRRWNNTKLPNQWFNQITQKPFDPAIFQNLG